MNCFAVVASLVCSYRRFGHRHDLCRLRLCENQWFTSSKCEGGSRLMSTQVYELHVFEGLRPMGLGPRRQGLRPLAIGLGEEVFTN